MLYSEIIMKVLANQKYFFRVSFNIFQITIKPFPRQRYILKFNFGFASLYLLHVCLPVVVLGILTMATKYYI